MTRVLRNAGGVPYGVEGEGPPLILLRGLGRTVKHWLGYDSQLARDFTVITLDLRGMGEASRPCTWTTSIYDMGSDVVQVLDHMGLDDAHIAGISLGGMVTLGVGLKHPKRCRSLIVMNTSIAGQRTLRLTPDAMKTLAKVAVQHDGQFHRHLVDSLVGPTCPEAIRADVSKQYAEIADHDGLYVETVVKQLLAAARFKVKRKLRNMAVPTLVVYGTGDGFVPNINSQKLARLLQNPEVVAILGGGHELSVDKGDELAEAMRVWVARHESPAR